MQGSIRFLGSTLLFLSSCSGISAWNDHKNTSAENTPYASPTETTDNTNKFLARIAAYSISELEAGQLAEKKAFHQSVKYFATEMVHHRRGINAVAKQFEEQINISMNSLPHAACEPLILDQKKRKTFDKAFMDAIITNHKKAIELLVNATAENIDLDVKVLITEILPQLQSHLDEAEIIRNQL